MIVDKVCDYFGVKIALYFAYLGHYTTALLWPAFLGTMFWLLSDTHQVNLFRFQVHSRSSSGDDLTDLCSFLECLFIIYLQPLVHYYIDFQVILTTIHIHGLIYTVCSPQLFCCIFCKSQDLCFRLFTSCFI